MTAGVVVLFGTFSGFVAAWLLALEAKQQETELNVCGKNLSAYEKQSNAGIHSNKALAKPTTLLYDFNDILPRRR
jgi:hypothetical protein